VPALKSEAQLAEFYKRGGSVVWMQRTNEVCEAKFIHPKNCPDGVVIKWSMEDAKKANLANKENWRNYPRQMLSARVQAEGVQVVDPGAGLGMPVVEEAMDMINMQMNRAAEVGARLTGQPAEEIPRIESIPEDPALLKKMRAQLNRDLLACKTQAEFRAACVEFQKEYSIAVWPKATGHKEGETFQSVAEQHKDRVVRDDLDLSPDGQKQWRETMGRATVDRFSFFQEQYNHTPELQTQENSDALAARGRELGIEEYAAEDNEIHGLSD
jgi:hypothetical protein